MIVKNEIIKLNFFRKTHYGKTWNEKNGVEQNTWYSMMHDSCKAQHDNFRNFLQERKDISTVLEVGCGTGIYPIKNKELFTDIKYTGIDISKTAIEYCKNNSDFEFICGDFIKLNISQKYDLVYSHAVIDHVYDITTFISKLVTASNKYNYVSSYRGFFPNLLQHKMKWNNNDGCYYNNISIKQLKKTFTKIGLTEDEFVIMPVQIASNGGDDDWQTIIMINKNTK